MINKSYSRCFNILDVFPYTWADLRLVCAALNFGSFSLFRVNSKNKIAAKHGKVLITFS